MTILVLILSSRHDVKLPDTHFKKKIITDNFNSWIFTFIKDFLKLKHMINHFNHS